MAQQEWVWVDLAVAEAAHGEQLAEHGGAEGVRDPQMLESATARPLNLAAYGDPDVADLAASYAFGIARNHPFVDGNKRTAAVVSETFLVLNGYRLNCSDVELVMTFLALAAGRAYARSAGRLVSSARRAWLTRKCPPELHPGGHPFLPRKAGFRPRGRGGGRGSRTSPIRAGP